MKTFISVLFCFLFALTISAQDRISVMSYNTLNYPTGSMPDRDDTLGVILDYVKPDMLLLQELKTNTGLQEIVAQCNALLDGNYVSGAWVLQQSNPASTWKLQQNLVYNTERFALEQQNTIQTPVRDINEFRLLILDEEAQSSPNYLYVFVTHLKSSQGSDNEELRHQSALVFADYLSTLPADAMVMYGGDFNVYTSSEDAYQTLLSSSNSIQMRDPIDSPGNWHSSSFSNKSILTQSTRTSSIYGDGSGGGVDDRFDFVLLSENMMQSASTLSYVFESYKALGNNGTCYNDKITDCDQDPVVPPYLLSALYHMSDHLPVIFELESSIPFSIDETSAQTSSYSLQQETLIAKPGKSLNLTVYTLDGKRVFDRTNFSGRLELTQHLNGGFYLLQILDELGRVSTESVVVR